MLDCGCLIGRENISHGYDQCDQDTFSKYRSDRYGSVGWFREVPGRVSGGGMFEDFLRYAAARHILGLQDHRRQDPGDFCGMGGV
jgi:hypothetical protein